MKKRSIRKMISAALAASLAAAMLLTGCGSTDTGADQSATNTSTENTGSNSGSSNETDSNEAGSDAGSESNSEQAGESTAAKGYIFNYKGTDVVIDADMAPVYQALGEPTSYFEAASCAFQGLDKQYNYGSFEIDTYPMGDKDLISSVYFYDDTVTTAEGITVFSSEADMKAAYGDDYTEENGEIIYKKDGMKLCFIVENGEVTSVCYRSTALDE